MHQSEKKIIESGRAILGLELGSTRIKAVLIEPGGKPLAGGSHGWESVQQDGIWSYALDEIWKGIASCYADLVSDVEERYGVKFTTFAYCGISAMMHGYLAFNSDGHLLVPFRTWRNNFTAKASKELTELLRYPMPQRWSVVHLHQAILNGEKHVGEIAFVTTLAGYVHWKLTGRKVLGIGDASGMFPIDLQTQTFDSARIATYNNHVAHKGFPWKLKDILPEVIPAGEVAGTLTAKGASLLDSTGVLEKGIPFCPPEGDAGTGMVATNSVRVRTGNVSAGTSVFAMLIMDREPIQVYEEIDLVATPDGKLAGMVHSNNCTGDYDAWIGLFGQAVKVLGFDVASSRLYDAMLTLALQGDPDCGGLLAYGYISGEHITGFSEGRPLFVRHPNNPLRLENFMRVHLFTALCSLRAGMDVLMDKVGIVVDNIRGHGGFFKTAQVGQRIMAAAMRTPVSLLETAGEGGAYGISLLAAFANRINRSVDLQSFLDEIFSHSIGQAVKPNPVDVEGFNAFYKRYRAGLAIERAAIEHLEHD